MSYWGQTQTLKDVQHLLLAVVKLHEAPLGGLTDVERLLIDKARLQLSKAQENAQARYEEFVSPEGVAMRAHWRKSSARKRFLDKQAQAKSG